MSKAIAIIYYSLLVLTFQGCTRNISVKEVENISIVDNINNLRVIQLLDLHCDIKYIRLEKHGDPLKSVYDIEFSNNFIFITDLSGCYLYDMSGNFIAKISKIGRGPGEYTYPVNIEFSSDSTLYIQDGKKFLVYDIEGNFLKSFTPEIHTEIRYYMKHCSLFQDSLFLGHIPNYTGTEMYKAAIFNNLGQTVKLIKNTSFLNRKVKMVNSFDTQSIIYKYNGSVFFKELLNDTLFTLSENSGFWPIYRFDFGKYKCPSKEVESLSSKSVKMIENFIFIDNIFETSDYLFLDCNFNKHTPAKRSSPSFIDGYESHYYTVDLLGVYNKQSNELTFSLPEKTDSRLIRTGLYNHIDGGPKFYPKKMINDSTMAMWIDAYLIKKHVESKEFIQSEPLFPERKIALKEFVNSLSEDDNPVLMVTTFK
jgi:hypothetical protein